MSETSLQTEEAITVKEYKHTHTHTHTPPPTHTHTRKQVSLKKKKKTLTQLDETSNKYRLDNEE